MVVKSNKVAPEPSFTALDADEEFADLDELAEGLDSMSDD